MHSPQPLEFLDFESEKTILTEISQSQQGKYLINYLKGLDAKKILIEPNYFDRDYLSEFSSFYSTSVSGYKNICQRVHFFAHKNIDKEIFRKASGGHTKSIKFLNDNYLGFCVLRPIQARLGRTVLKWYKNRDPNSTRVIIQRNYKCHIAGVELNIDGLAWQQQDTGVGACATIALWSALQSSAFDDFHAIPTTAEITKVANKTASLGSRTFPSKGLADFQLYEAIKELGLSPMVQTGDYISNNQRYFSSKEYFMSSIASYIRSGYPVIILGHLFQKNQNMGLHAVCTVGFRESSSNQLPSSKMPIILEDSTSDVLYIHDDNIGPNTRFKIITRKLNGTIPYCPILHLEAPNYNKFKENNSDYQIIPETLVVATHNELRASPDQLYHTGLDAAENLQFTFKKDTGSSPQLSLGTRFIKLTDYIHNELGRLFKEDQEILSEVRLNLWEKVRPMSFHLGLVRIGLAKYSAPLIDILYDTTDSNLQMFDSIRLLRRN